MSGGRGRVTSLDTRGREAILHIGTEKTGTTT